jgi:hypothetical protein
MKRNIQGRSCLSCSAAAPQLPQLNYELRGYEAGSRTSRTSPPISGGGGGRLLMLVVLVLAIREEEVEIGLFVLA